MYGSNVLASYVNIVHKLKLQKVSHIRATHPIILIIISGKKRHLYILNIAIPVQHIATTENRQSLKHVILSDMTYSSLVEFMWKENNNRQQ